MALIKPLSGEVSVRMAAPPEKVWDLVSDVTRIGEFSPETFEGEWTRGSTGPEVGATFRGHVKRNGVGPVYWTPCKVTKCEPGEVFEFTVMAGGPLNTWGYRLAPFETPAAWAPQEPPDGVGTTVTEYFRLSPTLPMRLYWLALGRLRGRTNERGMRTTLERMKEVVES